MTQGQKRKKIIPMIFNLSEIRKSVGDYRLLTSAELRILIKGPSIRNEQRVELYQGLGKRVATSSPDSSPMSGKTSGCPSMSLRACRRGSKGLRDEQGFELRLFCECGLNNSEVFGFKISGIDNSRGDKSTMQLLTKQPPYILTMSIPQNSSSHLTTRRKRSTDTKDTLLTETCCVRSLYIDFRKDSRLEVDS
ncbi:hypothetical protein KUCAC02_005902 [Chaenocephalus aceratus]|uniref:Uncharacterized protein n=1 Tax=Chaenocephalus aceratus TaxID=36190 RepID=A0ACB9WQX1_CHAAC|nr:hypothetical protein KUCAC02_005902 [Chaenocephalus aceratus]